MRSKLYVLVAASASVILAGCAGSRVHNEGLDAMVSGDYETAVAKLDQAVKAEPGNATYRLDLKAKREEAVQILVASADRARSKGDFAAAERDYKRVMSIESGNARAIRGLELLQRDRRHVEIIAQASKEVEQRRLDEAEARLRMVLAEDPGSAAALALRMRIDNARGPQSVVPRLKTRDNRPVTLQFRDANTKMVFEVLARQTGINFIFDRDIKSDGKTTIFVQQVPVEQAIDLVLGQNQLARQVLSDNMVMIYPNTAAKQKEYQDQIVRTFYTTNTDPKKAMDMLKTMLNAKTLFVDERSSAVVIRDTPEVVRMAERLLAAVDIPESEVMMEVEVLEISRSRLQQLGIRYPDGIQLKPTPLAGDPLVLRDLADQDATTLQISDVSVSVDLKKSVGVTNVLASPRIRARNHEKARILIGQRVPVITNSVTATSQQPVYTGNVQYVDVGLTLEVEPTIYLDNDVAIKVNLEVSSIIKEVTSASSGTLAYQIGTRNATTLLRLKDGETQILAGLINDQDRRTSDHIPGVGDIPLLGRLFGSKKIDAEKSEIVLSITPRIIRAQLRPSSDNTEFWYGTDSTLRSAPMAASAQSSGPVSAAATGTGAAPSAPAADAEAAGANSDGKATPAVAGPRQRPALSWQGPGQVSVGQTFDVTLQMNSEIPIGNLRSAVRFDAAVFELLGADAGDIVPEAIRGSVQPVVNQRAGRAQFDVAGASMTGNGGLLVLHFRALSPRPASMIAVQQFAASDPEGAPVPTIAPRPLTVVVQQ